MFVDSFLLAQVSDNLKHAISASIEALYIISGYPDTNKRQSQLSLEKCYESICSFLRTHLGTEVN